MQHHLTELLLTLKTVLLLCVVYTLDFIYGGMISMVTMFNISYISPNIIKFLEEIKPIITFGTTLLIFLVYIFKLVNAIKNKKDK